MANAKNKTAFGDAIIPHRTLVTFFLVGTSPATAANWGSTFFTSDEYYQIVSVKERHTTAGNDAGAVTAMLKRVPSGTAPSAGTDMLAAGMSMKSVANTSQSGTLHATVANQKLIPGQSLAAVLTGTPTTLAGVEITVELKRILPF